MATGVVEELVTTREAARVLGLKENTLAIWRMTGRNLPFVKCGSRAVRYRRSDVEAFIDRRTVATSADD